MPAPELPEFVCPRCHGQLDHDLEQYSCGACSENYPIVLGIPDFRVFPDPWISLEDDRKKATRLESIVQGLSFPEAVRAYWDITPSTAPHIAARHIEYVLSSESRAADWLDALEQNEPPPPAGLWIDIGCGTGDLIAAAHTRQIQVVGIDIALRWLVIARRRIGLQRSEGMLVCANAEFLPFKDTSFVRAVSLGTLEHCKDAATVIREASRVLRSGCLLEIRTVNRYSLLPEPHVHIWGVGFVPRPFADSYVRLLSGQRYLHHHPLSPREVRQHFRNAGLSDIAIEAAGLLDSDRTRLGRLESLATPLYDRLRVLPVLGRMVEWIAPIIEARGVAI